MRIELYRLALAAMGLLLGCSQPRRDVAASDDTVLREDMSWGPVRMEIALEPARISLKSDAILTITVAVPPNVEVSLPPLDDRVEGFAVAGTFDDEPSRDVEESRMVRHVRLTPVLAERYRLRPFAVRYLDNSVSPARTGWFPTKPIVFQDAGLAEGMSAGSIEPVLEPVWIYPPFRTVAGWVAAVSGLAAIGFLLWKIARRVHRHVELMRLSPRERALRELEQLKARHLVEQNRVKDFYLELTMIVRRYIERRHSLRAPEQTTEEFLAAAASHPLFAPPVVERLKRFLEAADLVKFAAFHPDRPVIDKALETAKDYIDKDTPENRSSRSKTG